MIEVTQDGDTIVFTVEGWHKVWTLRSRIEIPRHHILGAVVNVDQVGRWWHGIKLAGTDLPGLFAGGMFYYQGELVFWDVSDPGQTVIVDLEHERYRKLIIEVRDPAATVGLLTAQRSVGQAT